MISFDKSGTRTRRWLGGAAAILLAASLAGCETADDVGSAVVSGVESVGDWISDAFDGDDEGKDKDK